jgi:hypothetical protein
MTKSNADKIAALEREIKKLKAAQAAQAPPPAPPFKPLSTAEHFDRMHQAAERRANAFVTLSPERRREMERACSTEDLRDLVHASRRPSGPSIGGIPSSQQLSGIHPGGGARFPPGGGTGWRTAAPLGPPPGINYVDRLVDEQDKRDRAELVQKVAKQQAIEQAMKK